MALAVYRTPRKIASFVVLYKFTGYMHLQNYDTGAVLFGLLTSHTVSRPSTNR